MSKTGDSLLIPCVELQLLASVEVGVCEEVAKVSNGSIHMEVSSRLRLVERRALRISHAEVGVCWFHLRATHDARQRSKVVILRSRDIFKTISKDDNNCFFQN